MKITMEGNNYKITCKCGESLLLHKNEVSLRKFLERTNMETEYLITWEFITWLTSYTWSAHKKKTAEQKEKFLKAFPEGLSFKDKRGSWEVLFELYGIYDMITPALRKTWYNDMKIDDQRVCEVLCSRVDKKDYYQSLKDFNFSPQICSQGDVPMIVELILIHNAGGKITECISNAQYPVDYT